MSKTMIRIEKNSKNPYTMINNHLLKDKNLSWKAKGILAYLLSLPDDWEVYESELVNHATDGIDSLRNGVAELIDNNYIHRTRNRNKQGHFKGYKYSIHEVPTKIKETKEDTRKAKEFSGVSEKEPKKKVIKNTSEAPDSEFKEMAQLYQSCIGQPNGLTSGWISDHLKEYGCEWFKNALMIAEERGRRNKSYVNSILNNWKTDGGMKLGGRRSGRANEGDSKSGEDVECEGDKLYERAVEKFGTGGIADSDIPF